MFRPKLFELLPRMTRDQLTADITSGVLVGIVALPLAIAFGIASGVSPEKGLVTAVIGGFFVSFLGGSRVQIGGPTGAFIVIVYGILAQHGLDGLLVATLMAGVILVLMGVAQFGSVIKFIPYPVIVGFTSGIAVIIFSSQVRDFLGLPIDTVPADFLEKWALYARLVGDIHPATAAVGAFSLAVILLWPRVSRKIPGPFVAILAASGLVAGLDLEVATIGSRFGAIPTSFPSPQLPRIDLAMVRELIAPATTIAVLAAIEALLSAVVADGMIGARHKSNTELVANGVANIVSPLFGGIPVTGAIARTATNVKNGGRTPVAGLVHAVTLLLMMLLLGKWAVLIPMPALAAVLIVVAWNMSELPVFRRLLQSPRSDVVVLLTTFGLTVLFDLTIAIEIGMLLAVVLFMRRMAAVANVKVVTRELRDVEEGNEATAVEPSRVPEGVEIYEINGPFFFGAATKFKETMRHLENPPKVMILRMRNVPVIDATGLNLLSEIARENRRDGTHLVLSGVNPQPRAAMAQFGLLTEVGAENIFDEFEPALRLAAALAGHPPAP